MYICIYIYIPLYMFIGKHMNLYLYLYAYTLGHCSWRALLMRRSPWQGAHSVCTFWIPVNLCQEMLLLQEGWLLLEVWLVRHRRLRTVLSGGSKAFCPNTICPLISTNLEFLKFTRTHFLKIASHFLVQDYWPKSICLTSILERMGAITGWKGVEGLHLREKELDPWGGGGYPSEG